VTNTRVSLPFFEWKQGEASKPRSLISSGDVLPIALALLFDGFRDERGISVDNRLRRTSPQLFMKGSNAFRR
jgi:hypothetical protein